MKNRSEYMPAIDDRPITKEQAEKMFRRWETRKNDMEPINEDDYIDDPHEKNHRVHA